MYLKIFLFRIIKVMLLFLIFAVVMIVKNKSNQKKYGMIALAVILPGIVEFVKVFDLYFSFNEIVLMAYHIAMWLLASFVYVLAFLMICKATSDSSDGMITIFKRDYKGWNIAVLVAIALGVCSLISQTWYMIEHGDEYAQMMYDAIHSANFLALMSENMDFNTLYDRLVDLNVALKWVIIVCMIIPAVLPSREKNASKEEI